MSMSKRASGPWTNENTLRKLYVVDGLSQSEIANRLGCGQSTVGRWLQRHGIESRDRSGYIGERPWKDASKLEEKYAKEQLTLEELADEWDCNPVTIWKSLKRENIETRRQGMPRGESHLHYKNGKTQYYGPNWRTQRDKARERDNHSCQACGKHQSEQRRKIAVHHVIPRSTFVDENGELNHEGANRLGNLVSLCDSCHNQWEGIPVKPTVINNE
jgi:5-methylcytosine-specific restriction endonuclease McrA